MDFTSMRRNNLAWVRISSKVYLPTWNRCRFMMALIALFIATIIAL